MQQRGLGPVFINWKEAMELTIIHVLATVSAIYTAWAFAEDCYKERVTERFWVADRHLKAYDRETKLLVCGGGVIAGIAGYLAGALAAGFGVGLVVAVRALGWL